MMKLRGPAARQGRGDRVFKREINQTPNARKMHFHVGKPVISSIPRGALVVKFGPAGHATCAHGSVMRPACLLEPAVSRCWLLVQCQSASKQCSRRSSLHVGKWLLSPTPTPGILPSKQRTWFGAPTPRGRLKFGRILAGPEALQREEVTATIGGQHRGHSWRSCRRPLDQAHGKPSDVGDQSQQRLEQHAAAARHALLAVHQA